MFFDDAKRLEMVFYVVKRGVKILDVPNAKPGTSIFDMHKSAYKFHVSGRYQEGDFSKAVAYVMKFFRNEFKLNSDHQ